jgi:hypothetical protein
MTTTLKVGGVADLSSSSRADDIKLKVENYMAFLGYRASEYDFTINITPQRIPQERFFAGDVYSYKYNQYGNEYTFVFDGTNWTGNGMTSNKMREAIRDGRAYKCKLVRA